MAGETVQGQRPEPDAPRLEAALRSKVAGGQPQRFYYDRARDVQALADAYRLHHGTRPPDVSALYVSCLEEEGLLENEAAARAWADFYAHFDIEPSSSLVLVRTDQDYAAVGQELFAAWQSRRRRDGTYQARIMSDAQSGHVDVDPRPSEAVRLATPLDR